MSFYIYICQVKTEFIKTVKGLQFINYNICLFCHFYILCKEMRNAKVNSRQPKQCFETPKKLLINELQQPPTNFQSNYKSMNQSNTTKLQSFNMFKKKYGHKSIQKSNLKMLNHQRQRLQNIILQNDLKKDLVKIQQLDQVYVFIGRIETIIEDRKYYHFKCQDDNFMGFEMYFLKRILSHKNQIKSDQLYIHDVDSLVFQSSLNEGKPYFQFFTIFREIPIFEKSDEILKTELKVNNNDEGRVQFSFRKHPSIMRKQIRLYIEHFQKIIDFNKITFHNLSICHESLLKNHLISKKMQIDESDK